MGGPRISIVNGGDLEICCGEDDDACITIPGHHGGGGSRNPEPPKPPFGAQTTPDPPVIYPTGMIEQLGTGFPREFLQDILSSAEGRDGFLLQSRQLKEIGELEGIVAQFVDELAHARFVNPLGLFRARQFVGVLTVAVTARPERVRLGKMSRIAKLADQLNFFVLVRLP